MKEYSDNDVSVIVPFASVAEYEYKAKRNPHRLYQEKGFDISPVPSSQMDRVSKRKGLKKLNNFLREPGRAGQLKGSEGDIPGYLICRECPLSRLIAKDLDGAYGIVPPGPAHFFLNK